ncbi:MAG: winged helix-turn-helix domain-containing protein [Gammaproteobacteria bacterium]|nr:MAG: response regulator [Gammaproteobacteria bacterium]UCH39982.1 MAG: winged helix-turn-helix domain-containing protein [Gammaproteobacteria bacterium]
MNIIVVEDDRDIREMVCQSLAQNDFHTIGCPGVQEAKQTIQDNNPDCLVIDWMLPDGSGIELVRWLRRTEAYSQTPILMLTARAQESDMITGLESGADDYLTKPMSLRELNARVKALLRRPAVYQEQKDTILAGPISLNYRTHEVYAGKQLLDLTKTEFRLLKLFLQNPDKVFSREQILDAVWGLNTHLGDRTVDVHILRLRKLLKPHGVDKMIVTVRGSGYRLSLKGR